MAEDVVSRIDVTVKGGATVDKAAVSLDRLAAANDEVVVSLQRSEKVREGVTAKLERTARAMDAEYRALRKAAEAQRVLDQAREQGLSGVTAFQVVTDKLRVAQDNLSSSMRQTAKDVSAVAAAMSLSGGMTDPTKMTSKLSSFVKVQKDVLLKEAEQTGKEMNARLVAGMSSAGGMTDKTGMTSRLSSFLVTQKAELLKEAEQIGRELNARLVAGMSSAGGMTDKTGMTSRLSSFLVTQKAELLKEAEQTGKEMNAKLISGMSSAGRMTDTTRMTSRLSQWSAAQKDVNEAMAAGGKIAKLNRADYANLSAQLQDIGVMLFSGASPITIGVQQLPQIFDVFARKGQGERIAALKEFGVMLLRVATHPLTLFVAGATAAGVAVYKWQQQIAALTQSLNGLGRASGLTLGGANQIATRAAGSAGISNSTARGLASQFLGAGVSGSNLSGAIGLAKPLERTLGITSEQLAAAVANPAKGAEELAQKYGLLSYAQERRVKELAAEGRQVEAAAELIRDLTGAVEKLSDPTLKLFDGFERGAAKISNAFTWVGEAIAKIPGSPFGSVGDAGAGERGWTRGAVDGYRAETARVGGLLNNALRRQEGLDRIAQDAALAAKEITAQTYAQREAAAMERERTQVLRDTLDVTKATLSAEAERVRLLAQAQRALDDYVRAGQQERSLIGKTPFQRGLQEIENRFADLNRQLPQGGTAGVAPTARSEATRRTEALLAEATRRGLEPSDATFDMLMREGVGAQKMQPRLYGPADMSSTINMPARDGGSIPGTARAELAAQRQAFITESQTAPLREFNKELEAEARLLDVQRDSFFKSTEEVAKATKQQELINQFMRDGVPITEAMSASIDALAARHGRLAAEQERVVFFQNRLKQAVDAVRDSARDALGGFVSDLRRGASAGEALRSVLERIERKALDIASTSLTDSLFGSSSEKGAGSGLFSGALKAIGGLFGSGSSSGAGYFSSSLFSGSPFAFGFAGGGVMTSAGPVPLRRYANGGIANSMQMAMFGEGSRPEAYVPLPDGRSIPVTMDAAPAAPVAPSSGPNITMINQAAGVQVTPRVTHDEVVFIVREIGAQMIDANNRSLPSVLADRNRRR